MKLKKLILLVSLLGVIPCATHAQTLTRGPYLQMGSTTATTVRWRTSTATGSVVNYGTSPTSLTLTASNDTAKTEHEIRLTGLMQNTTYYYSVGNGTTTYASGTDCFFVTAPTAAKPTRIWVLGDSGSGTTDQINVRNAYYNFTGTRHTDLWLMLGDNAYESGADTQYQTTLFDVYKPMLSKSVMWSTFGNHDAYSGASSATQTGVYYDIHTFPKNAEAGGVASNTEAYYSFNYGNIHFVCLDSTGSSRGHKDAMANWLRSDLQANTKDWLIAFFHHPPYSKGSHDSDNVANDSDMIQMRETFARILEEYGVDLVLAGHSHSYERSRFIRNHYNFSNTYDSSYMEVKPGSGQGAGAYEKGQTGPMPKAGAVYFAAGSSGKIKGSVTFETSPHPAMWTSMVELGSVVLDIDGQQLDATFIDDTGTIRDSFTLRKGTGIAPPPPIPGDNGVIVDNSQSGSVTLTPLSGGWSASSTTVGYVGTNYIHDNASGRGTKSVKFTPNLPATGRYEVFARWTDGTNRATSVPFTVAHAAGSASVSKNQRTYGGMWNSLGVFDFNAGTTGSVTVSNTGTTDGTVIVDAVSFVQQPVLAPTITITPASLPEATAGTSYSQAFSASGGAPTHSFAITSGAVPAGLSLSSAGTLSGTPTASGAFGFTITATDGSTAPGPYTGSRAFALTIHPFTHAVWVNQVFTPVEQADPAISGHDADPDGDGISNLLEYAFNLAPTTANASGLPVVGRLAEGGSSYLTVSYTRLKLASDLAYIVEASPDLVTWTSLTPVVVSVTDHGDTEAVVTRDSVATEGSARRFLRVRVIKP
jgi:hypothetical protein